MCGVFGIAYHPQASYLTYLGLHALQHRGQEAAGIVSTDGKVTYQELAAGLVDEGLNSQRLHRLHGDMAIGHVRYSTAGGSLMRNIQPFIVYNTPIGEVALAHNGNIPGYETLRVQMQKKGALFYTESDSEILLVAIVQVLQKELSGHKIPAAQHLAHFLRTALAGIEGAYSFVMLTRDFMAAIRDPWGLRPLVLGRLDEALLVASETTAFDLIGARFEREVKPGEIVIMSRQKSEPSVFSLAAQPARPMPCIFELVYFARPDSRIFDRDVYQARQAMGQKLAQEAPVPDADLVLAVPDSATVQALGYARELRLPYEMGLVRSHYIGRTFIAPHQKIRDFAAKLKFNPVRGVLEGKKIVVVDDSIVRGTTSKKIIRLLKEVGGAKEIHLRVASPPICWPCFYGIDMPTRQELIASNSNIEKIQKFLGVASLAYLSLPGLLSACGADENSFCHACFSGRYRLAKRAVLEQLEKNDVSS